MDLQISPNFVQNSKPNLDFNQFFVKNAFQNLFSDLKSEDKEDDTSTNAPDSRTTSSNSVLGVFDLENVKFFIKKNQDNKMKENIKEIQKKKICLKKGIDTFFNEKIDGDITKKFKHLL